MVLQDFETRLAAAREKLAQPAAAQSEQASGILAALPGLTEEDLADADRRAGESVGFLSGVTPDSPGEAIPGVRQGVRYARRRNYTEALARIEGGQGTREDSLAVLDHIVEQGRKRTFMGGTGEMVQEFAGTMAELAIPGALIGKAAAALPAVGLRAGLTGGGAALRALGSRASRTLLTLGVGAPAVREALPRLVGYGGGAISLSSLERAMPGVQLTTDQAGRLAAYLESSFQDFIDAPVPQWKGVVDELIEMGAEATGGPMMKLPVLRQIQGMQIALVRKLIADRGGDVEKFLADAAARGFFSGPIGEMLENRVATAGKAAVPGMEEGLEDIFPGARAIAQELLAGSIVGGTPAAVGGAMVGGKARQRAQAKSEVSAALGDEQAVDDSLTAEGGDPSSVGPGATPEVQGPTTYKPLTREEREADVGAYRSALAASAPKGEEVAVPEIVEPRTRGALAAQALLRRRGIDPTFVRGGSKDTAGFFPGPGRAVVAEGEGAYEAGIHEAFHTRWAQMDEAERDSLEAELEEIDPGFLERVREWRAENARLETPELAREEALATGAQVLGTMGRYLRTEQGAADFAKVFEENPGALRRVAESILDTLGTLVRGLPISQRAAARNRLAVLDTALTRPGRAAVLAKALNEAFDGIAPVFDAPPVAGESSANGAGNAVGNAARRSLPEPEMADAPGGTEAARRRYGMPGALRQPPRPPTVEQQSDFATRVARERYGMPGMLTRAEFRRPDEPGGGAPRYVRSSREAFDRDTEIDAAPEPEDFDPFEGRQLPADPSRPVREQSLSERLALRTPAERRARPVTLVDHVLALGGFDMRGTDGRNEAGDITERIKGLAGRGRSGIPAGLLRMTDSTAQARGLRPDDMREALRERGFRGDEPDGRMSFDAMLDAIEAELGGAIPTMPSDSDTLIGLEMQRQEYGASSGEQVFMGLPFDGRFAPSLRGLIGAIPALDRQRVSAAVDWLRLRLQDDTVPIREYPEFRTAVKRSRTIGANRVEEFAEKVDKLIAPLRKSAATLNDVQRAMVLTAGRERNVWMREDRGVEDGSGLGLDDAEIGAELDAIRTRVGPKLVDDFLAGIARLNRERLDHLVETRMVDAAKAEKWHAREPHWVSMRDVDPDADGHVGFETSGRSTQVKNPQIRKAEGRTTEAENTLLAWFSEFAARMRAAEKNRAMLVGAKLAEQGVPGLEVIDKPEGVPGGFTAPADHVAFIEDGRQRYLVMASPDAAAALKGLNGEQTGFVLNAIGKLTRMFSRSVTGRNPFFFTPNMLRDSSQAFWTIAAERNMRDAALVFGRAWATLPAMLRYQLTGDARGVPEIEAAKRAGFKVAWLPRQTMREMLDEFRSKVEGPTTIRDKVRATLGFVEKVGDAFEMSTRYAAFTYELERLTAAGVPRAEAELQAGDFARELTLNFDTRGTWTPALSSLYAFFNPSVQGSARLMKAALSGPRGYKAVAAVVVLGAIMEAIGYALADDDPETGLNEYGSIPEWEKSRSVVLPFKIGGAFPKVTLPYGLDSIFGFGRRALHVASGGAIDPRQTPAKAIQEGILHAGQSFNPIGDLNDPFAMVSPTVARPFVEIERNEKFGGRQIMKEKSSFGRELPDSARAFSTIDDRATGWLAQRIADVLNLGGPEQLPTGLDVSPESVQHLMEFLTAGFGLREVDRVSEFALSKRPVSVATNTPVLRNFAAAVTDFHVSELYYGVRNTSSALHGLAKDAESKEDVAAIRERDPRAWALRTGVNKVDRKLSEMGRALRSGELTRDQERELRDQMTALQAKIVRAYYAGD